MFIQTSNLLAYKKFLLTGVANHMSLSWAIAKLAKTFGAEVALTYQGEVLKKRIFPLAQEIDCKMVFECDVTKEDSITTLFEELKTHWGQLDGLVHAIAFADKEELKGRYIDTSLANFLNSMHISCYSLTALAQKAEKLMLNNGGSIVTLSYYGANKVIPYYNVMGLAKAALEASVKYLASDLGGSNIRVNTISAGPIRTLAASGISDFKSMLGLHEQTAPLQRNTNQEDVAGAAIYLLSSLSSGVTGETHYVDCGYNIMGMTTQKNN